MSAGGSIASTPSSRSTWLWQTGGIPHAILRAVSGVVDVNKSRQLMPDQTSVLSWLRLQLVLATAGTSADEGQAIDVTGAAGGH